MTPANPVPYARAVEVVATAYCLDAHRTATGAIPKVGIVAVDPYVIPLHSYVLLQGRTYRAEDTGGDIVGRRLDIWMPCSETHKWGRRTVRVWFWNPKLGKV